ncbi:hypothetical protein [Mordavella massiliensis]|uniref:hypothetical protein n=1 Tax=Mordavella massiliensis TaxID=1871024 RepID=UPI00210A6F22|nr:hypothetical protein [Mordavella massiliensis]
MSVLAISVGGGLMGIWGMLLGVPVTTIIYQLLQKDVSKKNRILTSKIHWKKFKISA